MATVQIPSLPAQAALEDANLFVIDDGGVTKKVTATAVRTHASAGLVSGLNGVVSLWAGTQSEYDALTPSPTTVYIIVP